MKIEVAPERDGRVVITILPETGEKPEVAFRGREKEDLPQVVEPEEAVAQTEEEKALAIAEDPHALEELEEARKEKTFRRATEKQIRYFHLLARKAGIKDTHAWLEKNGFPPSSKDCSQAQLSKAIDMLKDLEWARSLEAPGWRMEPQEAA
ncbi:MAG: hypothetical protein NUV68_07940 [Caldiserica bacterium]|jgi:hypothetical protein|nr:hypothetical protein [Caldisericota bacterium]MDH7563213.1 hypothetical protein [Caldisericota bacterium]